MPSNNAPITPSDDIKGTSILPLARIKRIINADDEIATCSNSAAFAISIAAEQFLIHLVQQTHNVAKSERPAPRKNILYRDVANAVARHDNLEFLTDVVPRTVTVKAYKDKVRKSKSGGMFGREPGTRTLDAVSLPVSKLSQIGQEGVIDVDVDVDTVPEDVPMGAGDDADDHGPLGDDAADAATKPGHTNDRDTMDVDHGDSDTR